jgi:cell division septation protein DedD
MGFASRALLAAILGVAAAFVVACGSSGNGLLSSDQSSSIAAQLTSISVAVDKGRCVKASAASRRLNNEISGLPSSVDQKLVANLGQGAATVSELATKQCGNHKPVTTPTVTSTSTTASSTPTQPTTTTSAPPTSTTTPPTTNTTPPTTATNGGGTGTSSNTTAGGAPVGGGTKTSGG